MALGGKRQLAAPSDCIARRSCLASGEKRPPGGNRGGVEPQGLLSPERHLLQWSASARSRLRPPVLSLRQGTAARERRPLGAGDREEHLARRALPMNRVSRASSSSPSNAGVKSLKAANIPNVDEGRAIYWSNSRFPRTRRSPQARWGRQRMPIQHASPRASPFPRSRSRGGSLP